MGTFSVQNVYFEFFKKKKKKKKKKNIILCEEALRFNLLMVMMTVKVIAYFSFFQELSHDDTHDIQDFIDILYGQWTNTLE